MKNLKRHLESLETDELIHKLKNNYFQSEAKEVVSEILTERGVEIPDADESLSEYATYYGETEDEEKRRKHRQYSYIYSFAAPIVIAGLAWSMLLAIFDLKLNEWASTFLYVIDFFALAFAFSKVHKFIIKYDSKDFIIYPSVMVLGPTVSYLLLQISFPLFH